MIIYVQIGIVMSLIDVRSLSSIDLFVNKHPFISFHKFQIAQLEKKYNLSFFFHYVIYCKLQIDVRVGPVDIGDFDESAGSCRIIGAVMIRVAS
jgi:hypothetical protein